MFKLEESIRFWGLAKKIFQSLRYDKSHDIDGVDAMEQKLSVRGRDLNTLIGNITFTDALFHILLNRMPAPLERDVLDAVLVSFHGGFGFSTPSVLLPRLAATTGTSVAGSLAAGYSGGGQYHLGATEEAMEMYKKILQSKKGDLTEHTRNYVRAAIEKKEKIHGFGHPLFKKDPRPSRLRSFLNERKFESDYITMYDAIDKFLAEEKGVYPNIDGINAAILLSLGFKKDHGTGLFLLSRTSAMLAHVVEEKTKEPFYSERRLYPILRMLEQEREHQGKNVKEKKVTSRSS